MKVVFCIGFQMSLVYFKSSDVFQKTLKLQILSIGFLNFSISSEAGR